MATKNLLKNSKAYYEDNDYYEMFSIAEDGENKVTEYIESKSKNKIVLDAGCGTGKFLKVIEDNSNKYIGIDLSNDQLEKAKNKSNNKNSLFIQSNLSNINLEDNSVDLVISTWVLGTIIDLDERSKCLGELKRVLRSDGQILLVENDENSEFEEIRNRNNDSRTRDYNNWLSSNGFIVDKKFNTYFSFNSIEEARKCFEVIYGENISNKIKDKKIGHKIIIYSYQK